MEIALQTFTIRHALREDPSKAFLEVRAAGYTSVELSRLCLTRENAEVINSLGLKVVSVQKTYRYLSSHFEDALRFLQAVNCNTVEISVMDWRAIVFGKRALQRFCGQINALAARFARYGISVSYHHHDFEFAFSGGEQKLDILLKNLDENIGIVSDTYWSKKAGFDPAAVLEHIGSRLAAVHLRDYRKAGRRHTDCELGNGDIDFARVFQAAEGTAHYFAVEQNSKTPMVSIKNSLAWLKKEGFC